MPDSTPKQNSTEKLNLGSSSRKSGFTLLELIIVIAIMSIMTGVVAFNYQGASRNENVRTAAGELLGTLREAQVWGTSSRTFPLNVGGGIETHESRFDRGYGVSVSTLDNSARSNSQVILYGGWDKTGDGSAGAGDRVTFNPTNTEGQNGGNQQLVRADQFTGDVIVKFICAGITFANTPADCDDADETVEYADIHFKRPDLGPIISTNLTSPTPGKDSTASDGVTAIVIVLQSGQDAEYEERVVIWNTGIFYVD